MNTSAEDEGDTFLRKEGPSPITFLYNPEDYTFTVSTVAYVNE
jgi:hypothetical protein